MPFPLVPVIMGAVSLIGSLIGSRQQKKTNQAQAELAKYGAQQNQLAIDRQNQYNTPAAQMQRYGDAGLNPNLIYGQGTPGVQQQAAKYEVPQVGYKFDISQLPGVIGEYQNFLMKDAQIENVQANTRNVDERTTNESLRHLILQMLGKKGTVEANQAEILAPYQTDIVHGQSQEAYTKVLRQFEGLKGDRLQNISREFGIQGQTLQNEKLRLQNVYDQFRNEWMKAGITSHDHPVFRVLVRMMTKYGLTPGQLFGN